MAGDAQKNVAIANFSTDVNPEKPGQIQAFARLENFSRRGSDRRSLAVSE